MQITGNLVTLDNFSQGEKINLILDKTIGAGALRLAPNAMWGEYISPELETKAFEYLVASWNSDTPRGTTVEISAAVCVGGAWSDYLSWGVWGADILRGSTADACEIAKMNDDILTISGELKTAGKIRFKAKLTSHKSGVSPVLRRIYGTLRNTQPGMEIEPEVTNAKLPEKVILATPAFSQMTRDPDIGKVMCSATTVSVLLADRGECVLPEEVALRNYDFVYEGYGNWAFSASAAGEWGFNSRAQYLSQQFIMEQLAQGWSVGYSCAYASKKDGKHTYLENGAANDTAGHLITITGYETIEGVLYFYSSDSAATGDNRCLRRYNASQLMKAGGNKMGYIVHEKDVGAGWAKPARIAASCAFEGDNHYRLISAFGEKIDLPADFVTGKRQKMGCGTLCYAIDGVAIEMPENVKTTAANLKYYYNLPINGDGSFTFDPYVNLSSAQSGHSAKVFVYAVVNSGITYWAEMTVQKPIDASFIPLDVEKEPVYFEEKK